MGTGIHTALELWHLALAGIPVVIAFITIDRYIWKPVRDWRAEMDKWRVSVDKDLNAGESKMDTIERDVKALDGKMDTVMQRLTAIETKLETLVKRNGGH